MQELIRAGAERALNPPAEWMAELDAATLATDSMRAIADDPVLAAATRRTNRSNLLFWAAANVRAEMFVQRTVGRLEHAPAELAATVRTFVAAGCNASRAAALLFTHRNTVLRRLERADRLLPRPLAGNLVDIAVALEVLRWRGPR